jgi:hypothetical protein
MDPGLAQCVTAIFLKLSSRNPPSPMRRIGSPMDRKVRSNTAILSSQKALSGALFVVVAASLSACDPTAFISPNIRELTSVQSMGIIGAECSDTNAETDFVLRFTGRDTQNEAVEPGADLAGFQLRLNDTFRASDVSIVDNGATIYPTPDVLCETDADCDAAGLNDGNSGTRFQCVQLDGRTDDAPEVPKVCGKQVGLETNSQAELGYVPVLPEDDSDERALIVMLSGSNNMSGNNPDTGAFVPGLAPDPEDSRITGLVLLLNGLANTENSRFFDTIRAEVGVFRAQASFSAQIRGDQGCDFFTVNGSNFNDFLTDRDEGVAPWVRAQEVERGNGNHYAALEDSINCLADAPDDKLRDIVIMTDGTVATDLAADAAALGQGLDRIAQEALDAGVRIHVIQLDSDSVGRVPLGGQTDLAQLACLTRGSFRYVQRGTDLQPVFRNLASGVPASYEVGIRASGVSPLRDGVYTMAFTAQISVDQQTETLTFNGYQVDTGSGERVDTRAAFRFNRPCTTDDDCLLNRVCDVDNGQCVPADDYPYCPAGSELTSSQGCVATEPDPGEGSAGEGSGT